MHFTGFHDKSLKREKSAMFSIICYEKPPSQVFLRHLDILIFVIF